MPGGVFETGTLPGRQLPYFGHPGALRASLRENASLRAFYRFRGRFLEVASRVWADSKDGQLADSDASSPTSAEFSGFVEWSG